MAEGLAWRDPGLCYQEKLDGIFAIKTLKAENGNSEIVLAGEQMAVGRFIAFDVLEWDGLDVREWPLRERWRLLQRAAGIVPAELTSSQSCRLEARPVLRSNTAEGGQHAIAIVPSCPGANGGEFLAAVLALGGEGVVAKDWSHPYGPMLACKRVTTYLCRVTGIGATQAVQIADATTGQPRGAVKLGGGKCDRVRVGSIVKLEAFGEHASGLLREARVCKDTPTSWLVRY